MTKAVFTARISFLMPNQVKQTITNYPLDQLISFFFDSMTPGEWTTNLNAG